MGTHQLGSSDRHVTCLSSLGMHEEKLKTSNRGHQIRTYGCELAL